jgi:hypothetical protein
MRYTKRTFSAGTRTHFLPLFKYRNHQYTCFCARCAPQYNFDPHSFQWCVGAITPRCSMSRRFLPKPDARVGKNVYILDIPLQTFHFDVRSLTPPARYKIKSKLRRYVLIEVCKCSFRCCALQAFVLSRGEITGRGVKFSYVIIQRLVHICAFQSHAEPPRRLLLLPSY